MLNRYFYFVLLSAWLAIHLSSAQASPRVSVSIAPVHSLVESLMQGVASAELLIRDGQSPHHFSLSPSVVRSISNADLVVWIGPDLESPLEGIVSQLPPGRLITLSQLPEMHVLPSRAAAIFHHDEEDSDATEDHQHDHHAGIDPHLWLATRNASRIAKRVEDWLAAFDPENERVYRANARELYARIEQTRKEITDQIKPLIGLKWMVFHDAYQYFEQEFGLAPVATVTLNPERAPGVRRVRELRQEIITNEVRCVFTEPQLDTGIVATLIEDTNAKSGILDPAGSSFRHGKEHWFSMMNALTTNLVACLSEY